MVRPLLGVGMGGGAGGELDGDVGAGAGDGVMLLNRLNVDMVLFDVDVYAVFDFW